MKGKKTTLEKRMKKKRGRKTPTTFSVSLVTNCRWTVTKGCCRRSTVTLQFGFSLLELSILMRRYSWLTAVAIQYWSSNRCRSWFISSVHSRNGERKTKSWDFLVFGFCFAEKKETNFQKRKKKEIFNLSKRWKDIVGEKNVQYLIE